MQMDGSSASTTPASSRYPSPSFSLPLPPSRPPSRSSSPSGCFDRGSALAYAANAHVREGEKHDELVGILCDQGAVLGTVVEKVMGMERVLSDVQGRQIDMQAKQNEDSLRMQRIAEQHEWRSKQDREERAARQEVHRLFLLRRAEGVGPREAMQLAKEQAAAAATAQVAADSAESAAEDAAAATAAQSSAEAARSAAENAAAEATAAATRAEARDFSTTEAIITAGVEMEQMEQRLVNVFREELRATSGAGARAPVRTCARAPVPHRSRERCTHTAPSARPPPTANVRSARAAAHAGASHATCGGDARSRALNYARSRALVPPRRGNVPLPPRQPAAPRTAQVPPTVPPVATHTSAPAVSLGAAPTGVPAAPAALSAAAAAGGATARGTTRSDGAFHFRVSREQPSTTSFASGVAAVELQATAARRVIGSPLIGPCVGSPLERPKQASLAAAKATVAVASDPDAPIIVDGSGDSDADDSWLVGKENKVVN